MRGNALKDPLISLRFNPAAAVVIFSTCIYPLTITPPLGWSVWPDIMALSGFAKNTKQVAISLGCPGRPIGDVNWSCASLFIVAGTSGVQTGPGATALTRMPLLTNMFASPLVKDTIAPFVEV